jgi:signal transduction histidine kinase
VNPTLSQLIERMVRATREPVFGIKYTTRSQLVEDIDALLLYGDSRHSRRPVIDRLTETVGSARKGNGSSILVVGESGVGKTFLWETFSTSCSTTQELWAYHKSPQIGEPPYGAYSEILDQLIRGVAAASRTTPRELAVRLVQEDQVFGTGARLVAALLDERYHGVSAAISGDAAFAGTSALPLAAAVRIVAGWARSAGLQAVVVALDDLQWTDAQSLETWIALAREPGGIGTVLIARPGVVDDTPALGSVPSIMITPLTVAESRRLSRALIVPTEDRDFSRVSAGFVEVSAGNPFYIVQSVREMLQIRGLGGSRSAVSHTEESPGEPIHGGLFGVSSAAQAVVEIVALLLPPVSQDTIARAVQRTSEDLAPLLVECVDAEVLVVRGDSVWFSHDRLESAARRAAFHSGRWTAAAGRILAGRATSGDLRAAYVLARLVADSDISHTAGGDAGEDAAFPMDSFLSSDESVLILHAAARRAIDLAIAVDAVRFVAVALEKYRQACSAAVRLDLIHLGHRAAFLQDDGYGMSHYFRELARHGADQDLVDARHLWISRCYSKLWIRGALRIGKNILREYGVTDGLTPESARSLLTRWNPLQVHRRILAQSADTDPDSLRIAGTCAAMLLPVMSIDPDAPYLFAVIILRRSLAHGPTPYTPIGFLYWAMAVLLDSGSSRRRERILECARNGAREISLDSVSAIEAIRIRVFVGIIALPWQRLQPIEYGHLFRLYQQGLACGSFEAAAHAIHVYCYAPLFHGYPLKEVCTTIEHYRRGVENHGLNRISRAMGKFAQAALVLMGDTSHPLEVSGRICSEAQLEAQLQETGDTLGLAGLQFLRALLGVFHGSPEYALEQLREVEQASPLVQFLIDPTWPWFLHAMLAWKLGYPDEAREFERRLREVSHSTPGDHRYAAVRAERMCRRGMVWIADRKFRYAAKRAIAEGHIHDAAFIVERHAEMLFHRAADDSSAIERVHVAEGLYARWGASRKVEEMGARINDYRRRAGQVLEGVISHREPFGRDRDAELAAAHQALTHTREYAHLLFSHVDEALLLVRPDGFVLFHNVAAGPFVVSDSPESWRLESGFFRLIGGSSGDGDGEAEWRGRVLTYARRSVPRHEGPEAVALVVRDITRERNRERQLVVADRLSSLGMMAATVAHEVGNPNHIIALHAQSLSIIAQTPEMRDAVSGILEGSRKISDVVGLITRYGRDGYQITAEWGDPIEIGFRVERFTRILALQYKVDLQYEHAASSPWFWGYPALVEQALVNLVKNACEAVSGDDRKVLIRVACREGTVVFQVCDQGVGIAPASGGEGVQSEGVFSTTKAESGGSGLGLSIVRSVADRHGGALRYTTSSEFETIAELHIPVEPV